MSEPISKALLERIMNRLTAVEERMAAKDIEIADLRRATDACVRNADRREVEALDDAYPDWREIVGSVDIKVERPDPNNPFRKWLATKSAAYRRRVETANSAELIGEAIRLFQNEQKQQSPR